MAGRTIRASVLGLREPRVRLHSNINRRCVGIEERSTKRYTVPSQISLLSRARRALVRQSFLRGTPSVLCDLPLSPFSCLANDLVAGLVCHARLTWAERDSITVGYHARLPVASANASKDFK